MGKVHHHVDDDRPCGVVIVAVVVVVVVVVVVLDAVVAVVAVAVVDVATFLLPANSSKILLRRLLNKLRLNFDSNFSSKSFRCKLDEA